ncbi:hypothetical protein ECC32_05115 [Helicobacter pylori]|nr:hypothetical protein ECC32_05115 [Helicobacter pylori]
MTTCFAQSSFISFLDRFSLKLRFFHKFKLSFFFFFFDLILGVILILFKRKSYGSDTKHH